MTAVYRVDKFEVPEQAREEFWIHVRRTHEVLRTQPGFVEDLLLEKHSGLGRFNVVTMVRWASVDDLGSAKVAAERAHQEADFRPAEFMEQHGIDADLASYVEVAR